jgi:hypothetical protein
MTDAASVAPRRLPLRFSLRILLVAVTLFAIGFPVWYRRPYEEVIVQDFSGDPFAVSKKRLTTTTWQRQWGGGRFKHGVERVVRDGKTSTLTTYHGGRKHGPYQNHYNDGSLAMVGHYTDDEKDGTWTTFDPKGEVQLAATWRHGQLEGPASIRGKNGMDRVELIAGEVVKVNDVSVKDRLAGLQAAAQISSSDIATALKSPTSVTYNELPLGHVIDDLSQITRTPMFVDPFHVDPNSRVNLSGELSLSSALTLMSAQHELGCDYRFGCVWITSADDAKEWRDPTGITDLVPPTESQLFHSWKESVSVAATSQPLAQALGNISEPLAIAIDTSRISPAGDEVSGYPVTLQLTGLSFRDALGILLYQARCRVRLDGETLVILPPESSGLQSSENENWP